MGLGAVPTRFEGWSRAPALALLAALLALFAAATWSPEAAPAPKLRSSKTQPSDLQLYRDIIAGVESEATITRLRRMPSARTIIR